MLAKRYRKGQRAVLGDVCAVAVDGVVCVWYDVLRCVNCRGSYVVGSI